MHFRLTEFKYAQPQWFYPSFFFLKPSTIVVWRQCFCIFRLNGAMRISALLVFFSQRILYVLYKRKDSHKNMTFAKFLMQFQPFKGLKFQYFFQGSMRPGKLNCEYLHVRLQPRHLGTIKNPREAIACCQGLTRFRGRVYGPHIVLRALWTNYRSIKNPREALAYCQRALQPRHLGTRSAVACYKTIVLHETCSEPYIFASKAKWIKRYGIQLKQPEQQERMVKMLPSVSRHNYNQVPGVSLDIKAEKVEEQIDQ